MSLPRTIATAARVLSQLRRDPRTIVLLVAVPCVLMILVDQLFASREAVFQSVGVPMLGIFPLISMFLVTSITMLRERTSGTLERLLTTPLTKLELIVGYGIAFAAVAVFQVTVVSIVGFGILGLETVHSNVLIVLLAVANALLGMAFGLFVSAFARSEFQAVQFMPAFILPQTTALRPLRRTGSDGRLAPVDLGCVAAHLRVRRTRPGGSRRNAGDELLRRRRDSGRCDGAGACPRRRDATTPHALRHDAGNGGFGPSRPSPVSRRCARRG